MCNKCLMLHINTLSRWHRVDIDWAFFARISWYKKRYGSKKFKDRKNSLGVSFRRQINSDIVYNK